MRVSILLAVVLAASACGSTPHADLERPSPAPLDLKLARVTRSAVPRLVEVVGSVEARERATVSSRMLAPITAAPVRVGDRVRRGQLLFQLDGAEARARLEAAEAGRRQGEFAVQEAEGAREAAAQAVTSAEAQARLAETTRDRFAQLQERGSVSPQEYDEVSSRHEAAQGELRRARALLESVRAREQQAVQATGRARAEVTQAETQRSYTEIRAPYSGVVASKWGDVGDLAAPGVPLLELESLSGHEFAADVPESLIGLLSVGQELAVQLDSLGKELQGRIARIDPGGQTASRTFRVELELPPDEQVRSGLFGRLRVPEGEQTVLSVPSTALVVRGQLQGVFGVDGEGRARFRLIEPGRVTQGRLEVLSGLEEGETVVAEPPAGLRDGTPVRASGRAG